MVRSIFLIEAGVWTHLHQDRNHEGFLLNKGTAFTEAERNLFRLHGLLPPIIGTLEEQTARRMKVLRGFETDFERYAFLRDLQDTNETLFYSVLVNNLEELLPLV